ncbi:MAG: TlpA family protein disulfide reductase [Bacteroidales bacterium]|nr:TlpA family protein disulfide reductase [Bacteroidales bacterium]
MKRVLLVLILLNLVIFSGFAENSVILISPDEVKAFTEIRNDTVYLLHFWATWCAPCIKEIPDLLKIEEQLKDKKFKLVLISLDFENQIQSKLVPFLAKNEMKPPYYLLKQERGYEWINKINSNWSGALPASIIFNRKNYDFYEKSFSYSELYRLLTTKYILP